MLLTHWPTLLGADGQVTYVKQHRLGLFVAARAHLAVPLTAHREKGLLGARSEYLRLHHVRLATVKWLGQKLETRVVASLLARDVNLAAQLHPRRCQYRAVNIIRCLNAIK